MTNEEIRDKFYFDEGMPIMEALRLARADERERCVQVINKLRIEKGLNHYHGEVIDGIIEAIKSNTPEGE